MPLTMSMSTPASSATSPASVRDPATPWFRSSSTPVQSLTTNPGNFHSPRSSVVTSQRLAWLGMPPISLNEVMMLPAPASTPARYGGRYVSRRVRLDASPEVESPPPSTPPYAP